MNFSTDQLRRLNELVSQGLSLEPESRASWLANLDDVSLDLRRALTAAIVPAQQLDDPRNLTSLPDFRGTPQSASDLSAGMMIGSYILRHTLGQGGSAVVWLADKADGTVNRSVALKLPLYVGSVGGWADRVRIERDILAAMNHPNIATLYEAGVSVCGRPWLALEYVNGDPIDVYVHNKAQGARFAVELLLKIVRAVEYSHSRGVIHRDIKPLNILVATRPDLEPTPKLLDFGIAKLKVQDDTEGLTQTYGHPFTPEYASPEQLNGLPVTIKSDIYALGVVLYELLTGQPLLKLEKANLHVVQLAALQVRALNSMDLKPAQNFLNGKIDDDLWAILLNAIRGDLQHAYRTASALGDDLQRWLSGHPVSAQIDSRWYRVRRFVARNKAASVASAIAITTLFVATGFSLWQAKEANTQRDVAKAAFKQAASALRDSERAQQETESAFLESKRQEQIAVEAQAAALREAALTLQAADYAKTQFQRAEMQSNIAKKSERIAMRALASVDEEKRAALAERSSAISSKNEAQSQSERAILVKDFMSDLFSRTMMVSNLPKSDKSPQVGLGLHDVMSEVGKAIEAGFKGHFAEGRDDEETNRAQPNAVVVSPVVKRLLLAEAVVQIEILSVLARMQSDLALNNRALELRKLAIKIQTARLSKLKDPKLLAEGASDLALREVHIAENLSNLRNWNEADKFFEQAAKRAESFDAAKQNRWQGYYLTRVGMHQQRQRQFAAAGKSAAQAVSILTPIAPNSADLAVALALRSNSNFFLSGISVDVLSDLRLAIQAAENRFGKNHFFPVQYRFQLAERLAIAMRQNEAVEQAQSAWTLLNALPDAPPVQVAVGAQVLSRILSLQGRFEDAQQTLLLAKERLAGAWLLEPNSDREQQLEAQLAHNYYTLGDLAKAKQLAEPIAINLESKLGEIADSDLSFDTLYGVASVLGMTGQPARSLKLYDHAFAAASRIGVHNLPGHQTHFARAVYVATLAKNPARARFYLETVRAAIPKLDISYGFARLVAEVNAHRLCTSTGSEDCRVALPSLKAIVMGSPDLPKASVESFLLLVNRVMIRESLCSATAVIDRQVLEEFAVLSKRSYRPDSITASTDQLIYAKAILRTESSLSAQRTLDAALQRLKQPDAMVLPNIRASIDSFLLSAGSSSKERCDSL
jgi:Protein kinase domain